MKLQNISRSLTDILGAEYMEAVQSVAITILGMDETEAAQLANEKVAFFPDDYVAKIKDFNIDRALEIYQTAYDKL